ncbi:hypothetical protein [Dactylosporangium sp. CS-033363]|uniref:hypothetical protein n=1 Tax=Dactylosporangium sp. CS-033363 TaxID=3239935 RepID=UPI003D8D410B
MEYRPGDVLRISCPFTPATVSGVDRWDVSLRWPWWRVDPDSVGVRWNGEVALARNDPRELYATEPPARDLRPGDACRVGIPPRVVHVVEVDEYDADRETGYLPRPTRSLLVLPAGVAADPTLEFQGTSVDLDDGIPLVLELLFRPFAYLTPGDDVADAAGRAWRFDGPWTWTAYDGGDGVPVWPLTRLVEGAQPVPGSREVELTQWLTAAGFA